MGVRWWRWWLAAGVGVMAAARGAEAAIVTQWVVTTPSPNATAANKAEMQKLIDNGWACCLLIATADASSKFVAGWDFSTPASKPGHVTSNNFGLDWGIVGTMAQKWSFSEAAGDFVQSNYGTTTNQSGGLALTADSFFFSSPQFAQSTAPDEENNLANGSANPPYDHNPNTSSDSAEFGVGTYMKAVGSIQVQGTAATQVIAQVWAPVGTSLGVFGVITDGRANIYDADPTFFNPPFVVPAEPGSVVMLGVGGVLLIRRRKAKGCGNQGGWWCAGEEAGPMRGTGLACRRGQVGPGRRSNFFVRQTAS